MEPTEMAETDDVAPEAEEKPKKGRKAEPKPEPKAEEPEKGDKPKKKGKPPIDGFAAFVEMSRKTWPDTVEIASETTYQKIPRITTGNIGLDIATFGGWPRGRVSRAFGKEKSAKTGSCLTTAAHWQKRCPECYDNDCEPGCGYYGYDKAERPKAPVLWIDTENKLLSMNDWIVGHGIDITRFLIQSPPDGQHVVDYVDAVIRERGHGIGLIIVDSIAHITSMEELNKATVNGRTAPVNALLINKAMRKWPAAINSLGINDKKKPTIIAINQLRQTLDAFGQSEIQVGGLGMNYATSLDVRFTSGKYHYLVESADGSIEDKMQTFGAKWKPDENSQPDYMEVNYRITSSGSCPIGRYGQFNYWLRNAHGRRIGDPDNTDRMWEYAKKYDLIVKDGRQQSLFGAVGGTLTALKADFFTNEAAQKACWDALVAKLIAA